MTWAVLSLLAGIALAGIGGELFLRGVLSGARWLRIPSAVAAATLGAFATSSPEVFVSTIAALKGNPEIGLGDATGSNVVNIALILALALMIKPMHSARSAIKLDFLTALGATAAVGVLSIDGLVSRLDGLLLISAFVAWMTLHIRAALAHRAIAAAPEDIGKLRSILESAAGLLLLILAGMLVVSGATTVATAFGVPAFLIGVTLVAIGTSMPELATTLIALWRGHDDVGVATLLGSNVFNALFIIGIAALIAPITVSGAGLWIALGAATLAVLLTWPGPSGKLGRARGVMLILIYATSMSMLAVFAGAR